MVAYSGQLSLGHAAFFGAGAYVSALGFTKLDWSLPVSLLPAGLLGVLLAAIIGRISIRLQGAYFAIATFAFAEAMRVLVLTTSSVTNGPMGVTVLQAPPFPVDLAPHQTVFVYFLLLLEAVVLTNVWLRRTRWDFAFRAIRESELAASTSGVSIRNTRLLSFCISAMFVSMAGAIYSYYITYIDPTSVFSVQISVAAIIYSVFGGVYTLVGPLLGAALLNPAAEALRVGLGSASLLVYGAALLLTIIFIPRGIAGLGAALYRRVRKQGRGQ
jgi:branched-chain amino acid transport system permease protein